MSSDKDGDLTALLSIACCRTAAEHWEHRYYEKATLWLQQSMILFQRTGRFPQRQLQLENTINFSLPYKILDLVSRDLVDRAKRKNDLTLIKILLFNSQKFYRSQLPSLKENIFQPFFLQIFQYLAIQEQLDLFNYWENYQSTSGILLGFYAQVAIGFSHQKPELIFSALLRLFTFTKVNNRNNAENINSGFFYLQLLLGDVNQAEINFLQKQRVLDKLLHLDFPKEKDNLLKILFEHTTDWLRNEVLSGYRNFKIILNLEDWFSIHSIQLYIEQNEYQRCYFYKLISKDVNSLEPNESIGYLPKNIFNKQKIRIKNKLIQPEPFKSFQYNQIDRYKKSIREKKYFINKWFRICLISPLSVSLKFIYNKMLKYSSLTTTICSLLIIFRFTKFLPLCCTILPRGNIFWIGSNPSKNTTQISHYSVSSSKLKITLNNLTLPINNLYPSCLEVSDLITVWLNTKTILASTQELKKITKHLIVDDLINYIEKANNSTKINYVRSNIYAKIISLTIVSRGATGLRVKTIIKYKNQRFKKSKIPNQMFTVDYDLHYQDGVWRLYNYENMSFT